MDKASTYIYVVIAHLGYGEGYSTKAVRAFTSKDDAELCCERSNMKAKFAAGIYASYWTLMNEWERENPRPEPGYPTKKNEVEYEAHQVKRMAKDETYREMLRFDEQSKIIGCDMDECENLYYTVAEMPLDGNPYSGSQYMEKL